MRLWGCFVLFATTAAAAVAQQTGSTAPPVIQTAQPPAPSPPPALPEKGTASVMGQVVDARGAGVPAAIVLLQGGFRPIMLTMDNREIPGGPRYTITNANGFFTFFDLTPGTYAFEANKSGFIAGAYGRLRPGGTPQSINLKDGERLTSIRIPIWEYASMVGTVRDETGEAVVGLQVRALRRAVVNGRWVLTSVTQGTTNDQGEYRLDLLPPGQYAVVVAATQSSAPIVTTSGPTLSVGAGRQIGDFLWNSGARSAMTVPNPTEDGRLLVYPTTFYPSARTSRTAEIIVLESGQERVGVDLQLQLVPATVVSGVVMGLEGPLARTSVRLMPEYAKELAGDVFGLETAVTMTDAAGRFLFAGVPVGQYVVQGSVFAPPVNQPAPPPPSQGAWLNEPLTVNEGGATDLTLTFRPGVKVSGRIFFDGTKPQPPIDLLMRLSVSLEVLDFGVNRGEAPYQAYFDRDGMFVFPAVPPGQYIVTTRAQTADRRLMPDWEAKGPSLQGRDISDRPLTITNDISDILIVQVQTDHNSELKGIVRDASGKVDPTATVLLFTAEKELWPLRMTKRIRALRATENGTYSVRGAPPGDYYLVAIPDVDIADYPDPAMLEVLARTAMRISMTATDLKTLDLVVKKIK